MNCITNDKDLKLKNDQLRQSFSQLKDIMSMWRNRGRPPHSAELTFQILEVIFRDLTGYPHMLHVMSVGELQLLYSMVVIRAVNGLVDCNQQGLFASSVLSLAERIGLPAWIVELRHDSTHNQLPSLSVLRAASRYLLTWFRLNYWDLQQARLEERTRCCLVGPTGGTAPAAEFDTHLREGSATFLSEMLLPLFFSASSSTCDRILRSLPSLKSPISSATTSQALMSLLSSWQKQVSKTLRSQLSSPSSEHHAQLQWWRRLETAQIACPAFTAALLTRLVVEIQTICSCLKSRVTDTVLQDHKGKDAEENETEEYSFGTETNIREYECSEDGAAFTTTSRIDFRSLKWLLTYAEINLHWISTTVALVSAAFGDERPTDESVDSFLKGSLVRKLDAASREELSSAWLRVLPLYLQTDQLCPPSDSDAIAQLEGKAVNEIKKVKCLCKSPPVVRSTTSEPRQIDKLETEPSEPMNVNHASSSTSTNLADFEHWSNDLVMENRPNLNSSKGRKRKRSKLVVQEVPSGQDVTQSNNQLTSSHCAGIAKVQSIRIWPLGLVPQSMSNRLYMIESRDDGGGSV